MRELVRLARVNCIEPTQMSIGRQFSRQLLPDFESDPMGFRVAFDNSAAGLFAEDETDRAERAALLFREGIIKKTVAQEMVGAEVDDTQDFYAEPPALGLGDDERGVTNRLRNVSRTRSTNGGRES